MPNKTQKSIICADRKFIEFIHECLLKHGEVKITGLGIFKLVRTKGIKSGMNPFTLKVQNFPPWTKMKFRPTIKLKQKIQKWK